MLDEFGPDDRIAIVSLMDHTPGQRQFSDLEQLRRYMRGKYGMFRCGIRSPCTRQQNLGERVRVPHEAAVVSACAQLRRDLGQP